MRKIGYFIPEFPGQTHIFFWRERGALQQLGIDPVCISTRAPARGIISHDWAEAAMRETHYLAPPTPELATRAAMELLRANPVGWGRCLASIARAEGLDPRRRARLLALAVVGAELAALARKEGLSHVHVHFCADAAHVALFAHLLSGLTYSMTLHAPLDEYGPNQREKWRYAEFGIVITRKLHEEMRHRLSGYLPSRVEIAPMGVDLDKFRRVDRYEPWSGTGPLRLFSCGRLNPCKGHADLLEAVKLLHQRGVDARLSIAGEDEAGGTGYRKTLEARIEELGVGAWVTLLGAVSEQRVKEGILNSHVFALASLGEPLGVAIMEAMALETPVVVTGAGGVPELVDDGVDGVLVPPSDPARLAAGLERLARDPALAERLAAAGRTKVERSFSCRRSAELLASLLPG